MRDVPLFLLIAACFAAGALAGTPAEAGLDGWTSLGPFGGPISALAIDPQTPETLYAGTDGAGVFKSLDGGGHWTAANAGLAGFEGHHAGVKTLVIDPLRPATLYALTRGGVFKSTDGGGRWIAANDGIDASALALVLDPRSPTTLYVGTWGAGVFKSTDGGANWRAASDGLREASEVHALAIDPQNPSTLYVATFSFESQEPRWEMFKSTDGGGHWAAVGDETAPTRVWTLAIDPQTPTTLYAGAAVCPEDVLGCLGVVYESSDGGNHWSAILGPMWESIRVLAIDPQTPTTLYAGTGGAFESAWGGLHRSVDGGASWEAVRPGPPVRALAINPQTPTTVYAGVFSEGVARSTDGGDSWSAVNQGLANTFVGTLAVDSQSPATLYAGTEPFGIFHSVNGGEHWIAADGGLPDFPESAYLATPKLVADPETPTTVYACLDNIWQGGSLYRSLDAGAHWTAIEGGLPYEVYCEALVIDPKTPTTLYAGLQFGVFKTIDSGDLWFAINDGLADAGISALAIDPLTPETLYAGGSDGVYRSTDGGASWESLSDPGWVDLLAIDPRTPTTLYASGIFRLSKSIDGGFGWTRADQGLRGEIEALVVDPRSPETLYAGGSEGVFVSLDGGDRWTALNEGLGVIHVRALGLQTAWPPTLYAATSGGGVYSKLLVGDRGVLSLHGGRFEVRVDWRDFQGGTASGTVAVVAEETGAGVTLRSPDSMVAQFFSPDNWELLFKVLDGRALNGHFWVFLSAATNVEVTTTVTDTSCGTSRTYVNPLGQAAPAVTDVKAFSDCAAPSPPSCVEDAAAVCLGEDGRFRVETTWRDFSGNTGGGGEVSLPGTGLAKSDDSGLFYFFSEDNWELLVKVLDGCAVNDRYWVYAAATTNVEYTLTVTDTEADEVRTYGNPLGRAADAITDSNAFETCP